jgi:predicted O-methyltransferase YrrM
MTTTLSIDTIVDQAARIVGWMSLTELRYLAEQAQHHHSIVEVGSFAGRSTKALAMATPGIVYAIDDWRGEQDQPLRPEYLQKLFTQHLMPELVKGKCVHLNMTSLDAAKRYRERECTFDLVFIDGSHDYQSVCDDVTNWLPLVASGGLMCGHDWGVGQVKEALSDVLPNATVVADSIWEWRAP